MTSGQTPGASEREQARVDRLVIEGQLGLNTLAAALRAGGEGWVEGTRGNGLIFLQGRDIERHVSYPELWQSALRCAAHLRSRGVQQGDRILLMMPVSEAYVAIICAAILLGVIPCTIASPAMGQDRATIFRLLQHAHTAVEASLLVIPESVAPMLRDDSPLPLGQVATVSEVTSNGPLQGKALPCLDAHAPLHIQLTSGSTRAPKGVLLSHQNVVSNLRALASAFDFAPRTESILMWLPCYHDMGFVQLMLALYYQATLIVMPSSAFLRNPLSWLQRISTYRVAHSAAPTFAYSLCVQRFNAQLMEGVDLSSWRRAFVGAEPVSLRVLEQFARTFAPYGLQEHAMYPCYGMAETVLASTLPAVDTRSPRWLFGSVNRDRIDPAALRGEGRAVPVTDAHSPAIEVVGVGQAVQGLAVKVCDPEGNDLPDRIVGEICLQGSSLMQGYFRDHEATEAAIRAGWYHTGDRGYLVEGELYVLGRIKDLVIVRGRNFDPHDIEALIEEHPAVRSDSSVVFGCYNNERGTDDVIVIVESKVDGVACDALRNELQAVLQRVYGFVARDVVVVRHGMIPRTTSHKKQRALTAQWYGEGRFSVAGA